MKSDILRRLDLYQIIAFAKEGKTEQVIERAKQMLVEHEPLVTLSPEEWHELGEMTLMEIALGALMFRATVKADIERAALSAQPEERKTA